MQHLLRIILHKSKSFTEAGMYCHDFMRRQLAPKKSGKPCYRSCLSWRKQSAFVFIKPHAVTDKAKALVAGKFAGAGIKITKEGSLDGTTIEKNKLIDNHYYAIANKASLSKPKDLNPPPAKQARALQSTAP